MHALHTHTHKKHTCKRTQDEHTCTHARVHTCTHARQTTHTHTHTHMQHNKHTEHCLRLGGPKALIAYSWRRNPGSQAFTRMAQTNGPPPSPWAVWRSQLDYLSALNGAY